MEWVFDKFRMLMSLNKLKHGDLSAVEEVMNTFIERAVGVSSRKIQALETKLVEETFSKCDAIEKLATLERDHELLQDKVERL